jgi:hypothetical protein
MVASRRKDSAISCSGCASSHGYGYSPFPIMRRVAYYSVFIVHNSEEIGIRAAAARSSADWEGSEISEVSVAVAEFSETSNKV